MSALDALNHARAAWERSQPQTFLELYPDEEPRDPKRSDPFANEVAADSELREEVAALLDRRTLRDQETGCLVWQGRLDDGYGRPYIRGHKIQAARLAYAAHVGPIPAGHVIDHLCRNRACVEPSHLEPVTNRENLLRGESFVARQARQTHCKRGHPLSGDNVGAYFNRHGRVTRRCRECDSDRRKRRWAEQASNWMRAEPAEIAAVSPAAVPCGGLAPGAEPRHGTFSELTAMPERDPAFGSAVALARDGAGSAPLFTTIGPGRMSSEDTGDRGQRRSL